MENVLFKTQDPAKRCEALVANATRQCIYEKVKGSTTCLLHGGIHAAKSIERAKIRNYRLKMYQERVNELADSDTVKSLREEIGILRMILEEVINRCESSNDLLMYSSKISETCRNIERTVVSCHRLESSLGFLMDKTTVLNISNNIVNIISSHIKDEEVLNNIVDNIITTIGETTNGHTNAV